MKLAFKPKHLALSLVAASSLSVAQPVIRPQPAAAAGFLEHTFKNLTDNKDLDDSIKNIFRLMGAIAYALPVLALVAAVVGIAIARNAQSDDAVRAVIMTALVVFFLIGCAWIYDSKMVGTVNGSLPLPRNTQIALLDVLANMPIEV
jgi:hypothetical protein